MNFFDKIKSSLSEAGNKAKIVVDQNKLKLANVSKQSQIDKLHKEIGTIVAERHLAGQTFSIEECKTMLDSIAILKFEIEQNEHEINQLAEEKECKKCGRDNALLARQCVHCQEPFDIIEGTKEEEHIYLDNQIKELK